MNPEYCSLLQKLLLAIDHVSRSPAHHHHSLQLVLVGVTADGNAGTDGVSHIGTAFAQHLRRGIQKLLHQNRSLAAHAVFDGGGLHVFCSPI